MKTQCLLGVTSCLRDYVSVMTGVPSELGHNRSFDIPARIVVGGIDAAVCR